ncbi:MAG: hypothetical protein AAFY02_10590 [Pseudomonadota bacterium]
MWQSPCQAAIALGGSAPFQLMDIHASLRIPAEFQRCQFCWIVERLAARPPGPRLLADHWSPQPFPIVAIDQIHVSEAFKVEAASAGPDVGSDHLPIEASVQLME